MSGGMSHKSAVQAPHGVSSFDLVKHAARAEAPARRSKSDPVRVLLDFFHGRDSAKVSGVCHRRTESLPICMLRCAPIMKGCCQCHISPS